MKHLILVLALQLFVVAFSFSQNVGIGTTSPASKVDVSGDLALREGTAITVAAGANALTLPASKNSVYRLTGALGPFSISSISGANDGMMLTLINASGQAMTVTSGSIQTGTGANLVGTTTVAAVTIIYNATLAEWVVTSAEGFNTSINTWSLSGNSGTAPGTNFIGTTDAQPLEIKVDNSKAGYIDYSGSGANTGYGYQTLNANTTGSNNAVLGYQAMAQNNSGMSNVAIGSKAMYSSTQNSGNIAIGDSALYAGQTGDSLPGSIAIGYHALSATVSGYHNTAIGYLALALDQAGGGNTALGFKALASQNFSSNTQVCNTAIGDLAFTNNITGTFNTGIGLDAGYSNTTGSYNTYLGATAGYFATTGIQNTLVGYSAGGSLTSGSNNTSLGFNSMYKTAAGANNTAIGFQAMYGADSAGAINNTAVGFSSQANTNGMGNTSVGNASLSTNTSGSHNTAIGDSADVATGNLTNATAIGYGAVAGASNSLVLGGTGSDTVHVGIGTATPAYTLQVIGTTATTKLQMSNGATNGYVLQSDASGNGTWVAASSIPASNIYNSNGSLTGSRTVTMSADNLTFSATSGNLIFNPTSGGSVGIGTATPYGMIDVEGNNSAFHLYDFPGGGGSTLLAGEFHGNASLGELLRFSGPASGYMDIGQDSTGSFIIDQGSTGATRFAVNQYTGNVGIRTINPSSTLQVSGKTTTTNLEMTNGATSGYIMQSDASGNASWVNPSSVTTGTTNTLSNAANTITSTVNGVAATAPAVNTVSNTSSANTLSTTVNGVAGSTVPIINTNALALSTNTLTSTVNGVAATSNAVSGVSNTSSANTISTTVNGMTGSTVPIINTDVLSISGDSLTATINGVASNKLSLSASNWSLTGNSGTATGTDFIGTTDAHALEIKVDNTKAGYIDYSSSIANTGLGYQTLNANTGGFNNTAIGYQAMAKNTGGAGNVAIGPQALYNNTNNNGFIAIGDSALYEGQTGNDSSGSIAIGYHALAADVNGWHNTAIGYLALSQDASGVGNTAVGYRALASQTLTLALVGGNTAVGDLALSANITGAYNTGVGLDADINLTTGSNNTSIGFLSGTSGAGTGSYNTAIGSKSTSSGTGSYNTSVGYQALLNNSAGSNNTGVGNGVMQGVTSGGGNTAIGNNALEIVTTGSNNTAIGNGASIATGTLSDAVAIGHNANAAISNSLILGGQGPDSVRVGIGTSSPAYTLQVIGTTATTKFQMTNGATSGYVLQSDASGNGTWVNDSALTVGKAWGLKGNAGTTSSNFIGTTDNNPVYFKTNNAQVGYLPSATNGNILFGTGTGTPTGVNNIAIGNSSGGNTSGGSNVAIGNNALQNNSTGHDNVALGSDDLQYNTAGYSNIALGDRALNSNLNGNYNIGLGINTLSYNNTGSSNVAIGAQALFNNTSGGFNVAFGYNVMGSDTSGSNNVAIAQGALGSLVSGTGNVAIGLGAGASALGNTNIFLGNGAGSNETGSNKLYIANSGSSPPLIYGDFNNQHLTVNDSLTSQYLQMTSGAASGSFLMSDASGNGSWATLASATSHSAGWSQSGGLSDTVNGVLANVTPASGTVANVLGYNSTGTPVYQSIAGMTHSVSNTASGNTISTTVDATTGTAVTVPNLYTANGTLTASRTVTMGADNLTLSSTTGNLIFNPSSSGSVGINTASPQSLLANTNTNIAGNDGQGVNNNSLTWEQSATGYTGAFYNASTNGVAQGLAVKIAGTASTNRLLDLSTGTAQATAGTTVMVVEGSGLVGIGTGAPTNELTIQNGMNIDQSGSNNGSIANNTSTGNGITFGGASGEGIASNRANATAGQNQNGLDFYTDFTRRMSINNAGDVGIGTSNPAYPLDIASTINTSYSGYGYLNPSGGTGYGSGNSGTVAVSIHSAGRILTAEVDVQSDRRIKTGINRVAQASMLDQANALSVVNYGYIDKLAKGTGTKTGFIAQEVESVMPDAIRKATDVIPSVFAPAEKVQVEGTTLSVTTAAAHGFAAGDEVLLYDKDNHPYHVQVASVISEKVFTVNDWTEKMENVFVYGKKVNDFRTVDFDQITAVAIGAVQELSKKTQALEKENTALKAKNDKLESALNDLRSGKADASKVEQLETEIQLLKSVILPTSNKQ